MILYILLFYRFFVSPTGFRWRALYGEAKHPEGYEIHGIDISHYQGDIDWSLLRTSTIATCPVRFVMIKATEGSSTVDERFHDNFTNALEHGFLRGAYHFYTTKSSPTVQAQFFLETVPLERGDLAPVLDVEKKLSHQSTEDFQQDILTWLNIVEQHYHCKPIIYTNYKFKEQYLSADIFDDYPYWIAHYYVDQVEYPGEWKFWQYTDVGHLTGIQGYVDLNVYNGSYYDLLQLTIK